MLSLLLGYFKSFYTFNLNFNKDSYFYRKENLIIAFRILLFFMFYIYLPDSFIILTLRTVTC